MQLQAETKKYSPAVLGLIGFWIVYAGFFVVFKSYTTTIEVRILTTGLMSFLNLIEIVLAVWLWRNSNGLTKKIFAFFALASLFVGSIDAIYFIFIYNSLHFLNQTFNTTTVVNVFRLFGVIFEFLAWAILVSQFKYLKRYKLSSYLLLIIPFIVFGLIAFLVLQTKIALLKTSLGWVFDILPTTLYLINFILAMLCLASSKSKSLFYFALGYLIIIASDIIMVFHIFHQDYRAGSILETGWVLGVLLMIYGLISFIRTKEYTTPPKSWLTEPNSIKSQTSL